jgi:hypothetical protein
MTTWTTPLPFSRKDAQRAARPAILTRDTFDLIRSMEARVGRQLKVKPGSRKARRQGARGY